ncbi:MAG TPA: UDP-N-acetylmuramoylalanine--D-glutamate ligase, partial [Pseudodesulfovibrio sp.]|nr:UDP-N-acetylmuramoylalanine--D-glutamate ligase [Pseudodesulfovibrio sp.]
ETLEAAVRRQASLAAPGDVILLSPATSSFDQYRNMAERGADFKHAVEALHG